MKKDTPELMCHALRTLAYDITAPDDVPALCLRDAANMIEAQARSNAELRKALGDIKEYCVEQSEDDELSEQGFRHRFAYLATECSRHLIAAARALEGGRP